MAYAPHTCNFLVIQLLVWSRVAYILGVDVLRDTDWVCVVMLALGIGLGVPYALSVFRNSEVVVDGGPSLINDLLPEWIATSCIALLLLVLLVADSWITDQFSFQYGLYLYLLIIGGGLVFSVSSAHAQGPKLVTSLTGFYICLNVLQQPAEISNSSILSVGLLLTYFIDAVYLRQVRTFMELHELALARYTVRIKLGLAVTIHFSSVRLLSTCFVLGIVVLSCIGYVYERKHGAIRNRVYRQDVPERSNNDISDSSISFN